MMFTYEPCKYCNYEKSSCKHSEHIGFIKKIKENFCCIFPCFNKKTKIVEKSRIYDELFKVMNELETTSLLYNENNNKGNNENNYNTYVSNKDINEPNDEMKLILQEELSESMYTQNMYTQNKDKQKYKQKPKYKKIDIPAR